MVEEEQEFIVLMDSSDEKKEKATDVVTSWTFEMWEMIFEYLKQQQRQERFYNTDDGDYISDLRSKFLAKLRNIKQNEFHNVKEREFGKKMVILKNLLKLMAENKLYINPEDPVEGGECITLKKTFKIATKTHSGMDEDVIILTVFLSARAG
jgi:hypothetical protein